MTRARLRFASLMVVCGAACALLAWSLAAAPRMPVADHHMHLQSPRVVAVLERLITYFKETAGPEDRQVVDAAAILAALDRDGVERAVVISGAYLLGTSDIDVPNELAEVRAENDWTAAQARRAPGRLVGFGSINPRKAYAEAEVGRFASLGLRGLKLHLTNSAVDLRSAADVASLERIVRRASAAGLPMLVHMRTRATDYGATDVRALAALLGRVRPAVPIVLAHMSGWGGYDRKTDGALGTWEDVCRTSPDLCRFVYFELSGAVLPRTAATAPLGTTQRSMADAQRDFPDANAQLGRRIRALGLNRVVFGSDFPGHTPGDQVRAIRDALPMDAQSLDAIFANRAPFLR